MEKKGNGPLVVVLNSDTIGRGDDELGANLMVNFLHQLSMARATPDVLITINGGVKLTAEGSEVLESLKDLEMKGVRILACGTCLDFYNLRDRMGVGEASSMPEIVQLLLDSSRVIRI